MAVKKGFLKGIDKIQDDQVILIGSVTDAYQPLEKKYQCTCTILQNLQNCKGMVEILTKSKLILRDVELLKKIPRIRVGISLNTLDDSFRRSMEPGASSIMERLQTLQALKENDIETYLFVSPIFPIITDIQLIIQETKGLADTYYFENLNLRGDYKNRILEYISEQFPEYEHTYKQIYCDNNLEYWEKCKQQIEELAKIHNIKAKEYFYHSKIKKQ